MSGTRITRFRVELQDQHSEPVDTREEEYNCTIVIEYEAHYHIIMYTFLE